MTTFPNGNAPYVPVPCAATRFSGLKLAARPIAIAEFWLRGDMMGGESYPCMIVPEGGIFLARPSGAARIAASVRPALEQWSDI